MNIRERYQGIWTALVTPFNPDKTIDWKAFHKLIETQIDAGVTGIVLAGTTGEAPTLTEKEKISLIKEAKTVAGQNIQVMAGTGLQGTDATVELSVKALDAGADSLLVVTPPYNKPSFAGLMEHFETIGQMTSADICVYHVPGRTAQKLTAKQLCELSSIKQVVAIKEASADLALFTDLAISARQTAVLSGDDPTYLPSLIVGGIGCISVLSNIFPRALCQLTEAFFSGAIERAQKINETLFPLAQMLFIETNPLPVKAALSLKHQCGACFRLPLVPPQESTIQKLKPLLQEVATKLETLT